MTGVLAPRTVDEIQALVREHDPDAGPLRPVAGRTKTALSSPAGAARLLDLAALSGVVDYEPQECTFTARAGTPVAEVEAMLGEHGHGLPFDPPFAPRGATLGGTVASALSGPARYRYGGVRDFLLCVRFVDGEGRLVRGGGRVVKNAAGFYLHHLLLGSLGQLGVMTELTFKVFPVPAAQATVCADYPTFDVLLDVLSRLRRSTVEIDAVEIVPPARLLVRLGGSTAALATRVEALASRLGQGSRSVACLDEGEDQEVWRDARELAWAPADVTPLVKVATTPGGLARLEPQLAALEAPRRYGVGGELAWISWSRPIAELDGLLGGLGLAGLVVQGRGGEGPYLGVRPDAAFLARVARTLDPRGIFSRPPQRAAADALAQPAGKGLG